MSSNPPIPPRSTWAVRLKAKMLFSAVISTVVVRKQGAVLAAVDEVLLDQHVVAAFIRVDSPAAVLPSRDIMHDVVSDAAAGRAAGVNPGQIAEHALADVMHVIVFDDIARGLALAQNPGPSPRRCPSRTSRECGCE